MSSFLLFNFTDKMTVRQMNIKNRTYYFYNNLINIKDFDARLLKLDKKHQWVLVFITLAMSQQNLNGMLIV